jgi:hypothetical protein
MMKALLIGYVLVWSLILGYAALSAKPSDAGARIHQECESIVAEASKLTNNLDGDARRDAVLHCIMRHVVGGAR